MKWPVLIALLAGCASAPKTWHSPAWKACKAHCEGDGAPDPVMIESVDGRGCYCKAPPAAT